jgi:hypothetical protein
MIALLVGLMQVAPVWVGKFGAAGDIPAPWRVVRVGGARPTTYKLARIGDQAAVEARVDSSMALLARPISVDLKQTPILCWRWFIQSVVAKADIRKRAGNDFAARVYIGFDMPDSAMDGMTRMKLSLARQFLGANLPDAALTYVWDNRSAVGTTMKSPYTSRQQLIVVQSGNGRAGEWVTQRVNVATDFARAFAGKPGRAIELAIAADGDNTHSSGRAAFADLHFVALDQQCLA